MIEDLTPEEEAEMMEASKRSMHIADMLHEIARKAPKAGMRENKCPYCGAMSIKWRSSEYNGHIHARIECGCAPNFME